jgi:sorting nexin-14
LDALLDDIITEIVNPWFVPLCKSGENEFQSCVRSTINAAVMNLIKFGSAINNDTTTLLIYGVTNALIVHMEEYRRFETSKLPLDRFVMSHRSRRTHHKNYSEELEHLRQVAGLLLKKLAPKQESRSILLNSLMKEIISGNALAGLIDRIADPDFINEQIVKHMQDPEDAMPKVDLGWNMVILKRIIVL